MNPTDFENRCKDSDFLIVGHRFSKKNAQKADYGHKIVTLQPQKLNYYVTKIAIHFLFPFGGAVRLAVFHAVG